LVTEEKSFENIRKVYDEISSAKARVKYPMILIGNKVDLFRLRKVTEEQGREMAAELNVRIILCKINL
jgi:GTPase SAR1 family protein